MHPHLHFLAIQAVHFIFNMERTGDLKCERQDKRLWLHKPIAYYLTFEESRDFFTEQWRNAFQYHVLFPVFIARFSVIAWHPWWFKKWNRNIKKTKIQTQSQPTISSASYDEKGINFGLLSYLFPAFLIIQNALLVDIGDYVIIQNILAFLIG